MCFWSSLFGHVWNNQDIRMLSELLVLQGVAMQRYSQDCVGPPRLQALQSVLRTVGQDLNVGLCPRPIATVKNLPHGLHYSSPSALLAGLTQPVLCQGVESLWKPFEKELWQWPRGVLHDQGFQVPQVGCGEPVYHDHRVDVQHGSRNRSSHSATLPEWLDQPLSQPLWQSGWTSHSATQSFRGPATQPLSHSEWLVAGPATLTRASEWLSGSGCGRVAGAATQPLSHSPRVAAPATLASG